MSTPLEIELHVQWEHRSDRSLWGRDGRYRVIRQGKRNGGSGPDFLGAIVAFPDGSVHRGDVEIHRNRKDWFGHKHQWDPRYRGVMLHVISKGSLESVPSGSGRAIPTVYLLLEPSLESAFCAEMSFPLGANSEIEDFIKIMARQRWWRRLTEFHVAEEQTLLEILNRRLGPEGRKFGVMDLWLSNIISGSEMYLFLSEIYKEISIKLGSRATGKIMGRIMLTSALAYLFHHNGLRAWNQPLEAIKQLAIKLEIAGFPSPSDPFIIEVSGNWVLPLCQVRGNEDRFEGWYRLPLGWKYGRVTKHTRHLGIDLPVNFGQQQGILEWMESLCQPLECRCCPVAGGRGGV